jgi:hypothetical protein
MRLVSIHLLRRHSTASSDRQRFTPADKPSNRASTQRRFVSGDMRNAVKRWQAPCKSLKGVFGYFFRLKKVTEENFLLPDKRTSVARSKLK